MNHNTQQLNDEGTPEAEQNRFSVTVIGLGPMGQAMAGVFLDRAMR